MKLLHDEVIQFYRIWFPLLHFTNRQFNIVPEFPDEWGDESVNTDDATLIRNKLWEDGTNKVLDEFIQQNPSKLDDDDLAIVLQWKQRISGNFLIFRYLKNYTVFLHQGSPSRAYGVLGLVSSFDEMFYNNLPIYAQATILPFKDKIIYDSLISTYSISFGGGIKSSLNDTYRSIQEREGIIESLPFDNSMIDTQQIIKSNKKVLRAFEKQLGQSGVSPKKTLEHSENISLFADHLLTKFTPASFLLDIDKNLIDAYSQQSSKKVDFVSFKRFIRFLRDTYRIDYDDAEDLLQVLKNK